jgi:hypothetical protein
MYGQPYYYSQMPSQAQQAPMMPMQTPAPMDQLAQLRSQQMPAQPPQSEPIKWVQGEEGAKAYLVAAGNTVLLMDSENPTFYLKSTDASGMPMPLKIFDYTERTHQPKQAPAAARMAEYVTREEFAAFAEKLDKLAHDLGVEEEK